MALTPDTPAPDFALPHRPGEEPLRLSDFRGSPVVLLFFPLAFSSVCTKEMCTLAEEWDRWEGLGAQLLGVSVDSPFVNRKFAEETGVPFPVLSDFNRSASKAYDVLYEDYYGLEGVAKRAAFVVDGEGRIAWVWASDDAGVMPPLDEIRGEVEKLA